MLWCRTYKKSLPIPVMIHLNHLPQDKMAAILQTASSNAFSWMKNFVFWFKFHWNLFLRVQLTIRQHWFRRQAITWINGGPVHRRIYIYICNTRRRWVNWHIRNIKTLWVNKWYLIPCDHLVSSFICDQLLWPWNMTWCLTVPIMIYSAP